MHLTKEVTDHLRGKDLIYPGKRDYTTLYVYNRGAVLAAALTIAEVLCASEKFMDLEASLKAMGITDVLNNDFDKLPGQLKTLGLTVEKVLDEEAYKAANDQYRETIGERITKFRADLYEYYGVTDNPKADLCYDKAYDSGHSAGYAEVAAHFGDLVDLIV